MDTKKLKIAIIGEFPPPEGGMAIQAQLLLQNLKKEQISTFFIKRNIVLHKRLKFLDKVKILRSLVRSTIFNINILKTIFKADTFYVFTNSFLSFYLYTIPPVVFGKIFGKKVIIAYHGGSASYFLNKRVNFIPRQILKMADAIIVPSDYLKDIFSRLGYATNVIPNIVEFGRFNFRERMKLLPKFIVTRHLEPDYNVEMIIRSFKIISEEYPQAELIICGDGTERIKLEKLTKELNLNGSVRFIGDVENYKLDELYNNADIFLNASNVDNLPISILEAFACGLPVITTNAGGISYLIKNKYNGLLVNLNEPQAMANSALSLLQDPELTNTLIKNAKNSLKQYSWENIRTDLLRILRTN